MAAAGADGTAHAPRRRGVAATRRRAARPRGASSAGMEGAAANLQFDSARLARRAAGSDAGGARAKRAAAAARRSTAPRFAARGRRRRRRSCARCCSTPRTSSSDHRTPETADETTARCSEPAWRSPPPAVRRRAARSPRPARRCPASAGQRSLRADRAQGRQRRAQHRRARSPTPRTTRCARASRCPRDDVLPLGEHAALHPALAPLLPTWNDGAARGAAGRGLPGAQPVALPLDRDLGHRVEQRRVPCPTAGWREASPRAPLPRALPPTRS